MFGTDYDTPDGTCVRDYIHVCDLAGAHLAALRFLLQGGESDGINLGTGQGHSVRQIIAACEEVAGKKAPIVEAERRPGDPPFLVAEAERAKSVLSFTPQYTDIREIIRTAWRWEKERRY
jgi:UDP-glucose 4-epimerase